MVVAIPSANGTMSAILPADLKSKVSLQAILAGVGAGTLKLQWSNENTPANWNDVGSGSVSITSAGSFIVNYVTVCCKFLRVLFTDTYARIMSVTAVADVSQSLAGAYVTFNNAANGTPFLFWFKVSGTGAAPGLAGYTQVEVDISTNDTAATIAAAIAAATPDSADFTVANPSGAIVTFTQKVGGTTTIIADGAVPTGFTLAAGNPTATGLNVYLHSQDALSHVG